MDGNGDTDAENVIRLPRDWVGPPEELVPLGSRARPRDERAGVSPTDDGARSDTIPDAGDFWGESASAVHHAMRAPIDTQTTGRARHRPGPPRLPQVRRRTAGIAAVLATTAVVAIIGMSEGHDPRPAASATAATPARAQQSATASPGATARQALRGPRRSSRTGARAVPVRGFSERPSTRHVTVRRRRGRRGASSPRHAATGPRPESVITTAVTTPVPTTPVASTTSSTVDPPLATTAGDGSSTSATSTGQTSTRSSGPLGPGEASDCDPKCS